MPHNPETSTCTAPQNDHGTEHYPFIDCYCTCMCSTVKTFVHATHSFHWHLHVGLLNLIAMILPPFNSSYIALE